MLRRYTNLPMTDALSALAALPAHDDIRAAHDATLRRFAQPGSWWSAADRLAIVREVRTAPSCELCRLRTEALSPAAVQGEHDSAGVLPPVAVEAIHGIRNDSGRLTRRWFDDLIDMGLQPQAYVELVSVVASAVIVDTFAQGIGGVLPDLPEAEPGVPSFDASADVVDDGAYLPIARQGRANILRSLGLVPSARQLFFDTFSPSYFMQAGSPFAIDRRQVELVASRVSAVNQCFY